MGSKMYTSVKKADGDDTVRSVLNPVPAHLISESKPYSMFLIQAFWVVMVCEVDLFFSAITGGPFYRIPAVLAPLLVLSIVFKQIDRRIVYWPLLLFLLLHVGASVFAENAGLSRGSLKILVYMVVLFSASAALLDSPSKLIVILKIYLISFAWMSIQGIPSGKVSWHPLLANEDSYGPLMVMAMVFSYFFANATSSRKWRLIAYSVGFLSVLGLIFSFARGAGLAGAVVVGYIIMYSPHNKFRTMAVLVLAAVLILPLAATVVPLDSYINEIQSSSEGDTVRTALWRLAWNVFLESPIYGVGASNFGVVASRIADAETIRGVWNDPGNLYGLAVHNATIQILAEEGIIGVTLWIVMIVGFFQRVRLLHTVGAIARWKNQGGEGLDLSLIARGLEGAMIGYLATSIFYNQLYIHWFWALITIGYILARLTSPTDAVGK